MLVGVTINEQEEALYGPFRGKRVAQKWANNLKNLGTQKGLSLETRLVGVTKPRDPDVTTEQLLRQ